MNEIQLYSMQEDEGFGNFLIESIAKHLGVASVEKTISDRVYTDSENGVSVKFDEKGIYITTSVEGSPFEYGEYVNLDGIETDDDGEKLLIERFRLAVEQAEDAANDHIVDNNIVVIFEISETIQGEDRDLLRETALGSYPNLLVSEDSEFDESTWKILAGEVSEEKVEAEIELLAECVERCYKLTRHDRVWEIQGRV